MSWSLGEMADSALGWGSGLLDNVSETYDSFIDSLTRDDAATNASTYPQSTKQADSHGNAVTGASQQQATPQDKTLIYVGGGVAAVLVLGLFVIALKK